MLTRLKVDGFKNLDGVEVRFGPFTCVAGANGVGKSNLFDAITFLSALANGTVVDAARRVRGGGGETGDLRSLFRCVGHRVVDRMAFEVDILLPRGGRDFINQEIHASATLLTYRLVLRRLERPTAEAAGPVVVEHESLTAVPRTHARQVIGFDAGKPWFQSVFEAKSGKFIRTEGEDATAVVHLHNDSDVGKGRGRPATALAHSLTSTMLSSVTLGADHRTLVLARREMMGWTQLQLEPSALRRPDHTFTRPGIAPDGAHLAATLWALLKEAEGAERGGEANMRARLSNRLAALVDDVRDLRVDVDDQRNLVTLILRDKAGTPHTAAVLSDGTLRFIALTLLQESAAGPSVLCFEEPENGIHPAKIPEMVALLEDYTVDSSLAVGEGNPLRQVILNTHSPSVVACVPDDALLVADRPGVFLPRHGQPAVRFRPLPHTWRARLDREVPAAGRTELLAYLNPLLVAVDSSAGGVLDTGATRVVSRSADLQLALSPTARGA